MADFKQAFKDTSSNEGGYSNNSSDSGGETYRGIARKWHPDWKGWTRIDAIKQRLSITNTLDCDNGTRRKLESALEADEELSTLVQEFYKQNYWDTLNLDNEVSQQVANKLFDVAVNMGLATARSFYKEAKQV